MSKTIKETNIVINNTEQLRDIILSGKFDNSIQVKNTEHICHDGTIYDYSSITNLNNMFIKYSELTSIPLFDTSNVTTMSFMFSYCSNLKYIPPLDTSNVTDMYAMFEDCSSLTSIPLLDTSNVTNMKYMFKECCLLTKKEQIKFFYQKDKLLLKSLELNPELFSEDKLDKLILKKYIPKESGLK